MEAVGSNTSHYPESEEGHLKSLGLSVERLETDLHSAVRSEQRHWTENDAKLRAVHQKVATYDEFRGIVDGCELRPLNFKEVEEATKRHAGWAPAIAATSHAPPPPPSPAKPQPLMGDACREHSVAPVFSSPDQFIAHWISLTSSGHPSDVWKTSCAALLTAQQPAFVQSLFVSSRALVILPQVLLSLLHRAESDEKHVAFEVVDLMRVIGDSENFNLTSILLSDEEKATVRRILDALEKWAPGTHLEDLRTKWCIH